jgi:hypothetical protein
VKLLMSHVAQPVVVDVLPTVCDYGVSAVACVLHAADIPAVSVVTVTAGVPAVTSTHFC